MRPALERCSARGASPVPLARVRVGDAIDVRGIREPLRHDAELRSAAEALLASGHSAVLVAGRGEEGPLGMLTENDLVRAYFEGVPAEEPVGEWLGSGLARAPAALLERLTVRASETLAAVAERVVANVLAGDCACHHVLVEAEGGGHLGVLSAVDLARLLCRPGAWADALAQHLGERGGGAGPRAQGPTVGAAMKPREGVLTCAPDASVREALRLLLLSRQNSLLVADAGGVRGLLTARGLARAFADAVPLGGAVAALAAAAGARVVGRDDHVLAAAALMGELGREHLLVVQPGTGLVVGTISSLDIILCTGAREAHPRPVQMAAGPTVGEFLAEQKHGTPACQADATLSDAAKLLLSSGRTAVVVGGEGAPPSLLNETDIMRALVDGWPCDTSVKRWMLSQESHWSRRPQHLLVQPSVLLTEAAARLLDAGTQSRVPCHHLVVQGAESEWLGVFSALDVARALSRLGSELEVSRTGADRTTVASVMKRAVPRCGAGDLLVQVLHLLLSSGQHCALVAEGSSGADLRGVVTPRCAVRALAAGAPRDASVAACLEWGAAAAPREVAASAPLLEAARAMAERGLHHLVVVEGPAGGAPLGVVSSLDLARGIASAGCRVPFVSLKWLWECRGRSSCSLPEAGGA